MVISFTQIFATHCAYFGCCHLKCAFYKKDPEWHDIVHIVMYTMLYKYGTEGLELELTAFEINGEK